MKQVPERALLAFTLGVAMAALVWLNLSEASPLYSYFLETPRVGHTLLVLNLPSLFLSRVLSGTPPLAWVVYLSCFAQWSALGFGLSFAIWRRTPGREAP